MTEDEAKTKWCFQAVASHTDPRAGFREGEMEGSYRHFPCIGSACMAWRVTDPKPQDVSSWTCPSGEGWYQVREHTDTTLPLWRRADPAAEGYCGLAGAPQ